jgi:hypothetical protein
MGLNRLSPIINPDISHGGVEHSNYVLLMLNLMWRVPELPQTPLLTPKSAYDIKFPKNSNVSDFM